MAESIYTTTGNNNSSLEFDRHTVLLNVKQADLGAKLHGTISGVIATITDVLLHSEKKSPDRAAQLPYEEVRATTTIYDPANNQSHYTVNLDRPISSNLSFVLNNGENYVVNAGETEGFSGYRTGLVEEGDGSLAGGAGMDIKSNGNSCLDEVDEDKSEGGAKGKDGDDEDFNDLCEETNYDPESGPDKYDDDFNSSDFDSMIF